MQFPTPFYRHLRRTRTAVRTFRARLGFLVAHATRPFAGPAPNWTIFTIFVLGVMLALSLLGNIGFLSLFLIAAFG